MVREFDDALIMKIIKETKQFMADCNSYFDKLNDPLTTTEEIVNSPLEFIQPHKPSFFTLA